MPAYVTPGVYFERVDLERPQVAPVRTDIAGFVGLAERGPLDRAVRLTSWKQYESAFGGFIAQGRLPYAVKGFFDNGGRVCYVVRVAGPTARASSLVVPDRRPGQVTSLVEPVTALVDPPVVRVLAAAGIRVGDAVEIRAGDLRMRGEVAAVEVATGRVTLTGLVPVPFPAGATVTTRRPSLRISASSAGQWGNRLAVRLAEVHAGSAVRVGTQPADRLASVVGSVVGFEGARREEVGLVGGSLVRLTQVQVGGLVEEYHRPVVVDAGLRRLVWDAPLGAAFDLAAPISILTVEYLLEVSLGRRIVERFPLLSPIYGHPRWMEDLIASQSSWIRLVDQRRAEAVEAAGPALAEAVRKTFQPGPLDLPDFEWAEHPAPFRGGRDGLQSLGPEHLVGSTAALEKRGLRTLEDVDAVSIVAVPDLMIQPVVPPATADPAPIIPDPCAPAPPPEEVPEPVIPDMVVPFTLTEIRRAQEAIIAHCETMRDRFAILDAPRHPARETLLSVDEILEWRRQLYSERGFAALYYPWLKLYDPGGSGDLQLVPPSGHIAGAYARTDLQHGVHRAPANVALEWVVDVDVPLDEVQHGLLNEQGVNAIRPYAGRGIRVYGARTISTEPQWRYVNVRRLLLMIEEAIEESSQWAVFELNTVLLRQTLILALTTFLDLLWQRGALAGAVAGEAYFVKCDEENNPRDVVDRGELVAEIAVAPSIPAEFVVVRLGRIESQLQVFE